MRWKPTVCLTFDHINEHCSLQVPARQTIYNYIPVLIFQNSAQYYQTLCCFNTHGIVDCNRTQTFRVKFSYCWETGSIFERSVFSSFTQVMLCKLKRCGAYLVDFTVDGVTVHTLTFYEASGIVYLLKHACISY